MRKRLTGSELPSHLRTYVMCSAYIHLFLLYYARPHVPRTHTHTCTRLYIRMYPPTFTGTYIHTYTPTHMHIYIHTYIRSVRVAERLALPISDHWVACSNPTGGAILPEPTRSVSYSPFHRHEMTEIMLTYPYIHTYMHACIHTYT